MRLVLSSVLIVFGNMKIQKSIHSGSIRRLLFMVPVLCSLTFAGCSEFGGTAGTHATVNWQNGAVGEGRTGDYLTVGPSTYNSETRSFDRPWPFGPESSAQ
jgi:hypothetical protein